MTLDPTKLAGVGTDQMASRDHAPDTCAALEWRPIETAPRDGTAVDLWRDGERLTDWRFNALRHGWYQERGYPVVTVYLTVPPTHWMPLPAAPSSATLTERDKSRDEQDALSTQTQGVGEHG